jgi:nucleoside-diphosphate-sugar epimerase
VQRLLGRMVTKESNDDELQDLPCRRVRGDRQAPDATPAQRRPLCLWQHQVESESRRPTLARGDPVVVDVFDATELSRAVASARPDVVIHQLTDLPKDLNPREMGAAIIRTARIRGEGTRNLVRAAIAAGGRRLVAQSIAWAYAPGAEPHVETDPLDAGAEGDGGINVQGLIALEDLTLKSPPLEGVVLRYGQLYGPGTASDRPSGSSTGT